MNHLTANLDALLIALIGLLIAGPLFLLLLWLRDTRLGHWLQRRFQRAWHPVFLEAYSPADAAAAATSPLQK